MRNIMLLPLLMLLTFSSLAQDPLLNTKPPKASYSKRSKDQKTGAFVLCGAGLAGLLGTSIADAGQTVGGAFATLITLGEYEPEYKSYTGAYVLSGACLVGGIYLFTAASKNKRKAKAAMTMGMEKTEVLRYGSVYKRSFPAVGFKIRI